MSEPSPIGSPERRLDLLEAKVVPLLERIALALETLAASGPLTPVGPGRAPAATRLREAIAGEDWSQAAAVVDELSPDDPVGRRLAEELATARAAALDDLRARLEAARQVNDPDATIGLRDRMAPLLDVATLGDLDRVLAKWLMGLIQRRLRGGTIGPDVAQLAGAVADRFGGTAEGASLRAGLPTLRRSAGLCPRCGDPYVGEEDLCPKCRAEVAPAPAPQGGPMPGFAAEADIEEAEVEPLDLNNERNWGIS